MADFSLSQIGEQSGSPVQPQQGVVSGAANSALSSVAEIGSALFESVTENRSANAEAEAKTQVNKAVARFSTQQMQIADLVDQGKLSSQEGRMRMRYNLTRAQTDNPNLGEAFSDTHKQVVGTAGMGKVADVGTEKEQQLFKITQEARENGFIEAGMTPDQEKERTFDWMDLQSARFQRELAMEELAHQQAQTSLARGQIGLQRDRLSLQQARTEKKVLDATMEGARAFLPTFSSRVQNVVRATEAGEITPVQADLQLRQLIDQVDGEFRQGGASVSETVLNNLITPYNSMVETAQGVISGEFGVDVLNSQRDNMVARTEVAILARDPEAQALAATSNILGTSAGVLLQSHGSDAVTNAINIYSNNNRGGEGTAENPFAKDTETVGGYSRLIDNGLRQVNRGTEGPNAQGDVDEMNRQINGMFQSIGKYAEGEEFGKVKPLLERIGSDEYGEYITNKGKGAVRKEFEGQVQDYTQSLFLDEIQPLITEEWRNANTQLSALRVGPGPEGMTEEAATPSLIRPMWVGDGIEFVRTNRAGENPRIDAEIRRLNGNVKQAVNFFIRLGAHTEEHTDYRKVYEAQYAELFGEAGTGGEQ